MDNLDAWLAAMPVKDVQDRIKVLERELEVLRTLERQHRQRTAAAPTPRIVTARPYGGGEAVPAGKRRARRLSPERAAIIRIVSEHPDGMSPAEVTSALQASGMNAEQNPVQTTMSRMAHADQLVRVEHGRYRLPSDTSAASLLNGSAGGEEE